MVLYAWKESFCTGIAHIDAQHRQFYYLVNELDLAIEQRREEDVLGMLLKEVDRYVRVHFDTEEKLMEGIGYPDLPRHRKEHEYFAGQVGSLHVRQDAGEANVGRTALLFLSDWFTNHVLTEDRRYAEFLFAGRSPLV